MNTLLPQFRVAAELEQRLGDTQLPQNLFSFKATMERDEGEIYPEQAVNFLSSACPKTQKCHRNSPKSI